MRQHITTPAITEEELVRAMDSVDGADPRDRTIKKKYAAAILSKLKRS